MTALTDEDTELDQQWREAFGQPLPMLGAANIARKVLQQYRDHAFDRTNAPQGFQARRGISPTRG
jgi:hypothetical protein